MDFEEWEPLYEKIVDEFQFSKAKDDSSARILAELCRGKRICAVDCLRNAIGKKVTICGFGPGLEDDLLRAGIEGTVITADGATSILMRTGVVPDIIVTDLDGDIFSQVSANREGAIAVVLAHGDNVETIRNVVPLLEGPITPTTQGRPFNDVMNFGGFTDGDRSVILARHFGAKEIKLLGFDFSRPREQEGKEAEIKKRKLRWAKRLIFDFNPPDVSLSIP